MIHNNVAIIVNHSFYLSQIYSADVMLLREYKLFSVPNIFCITTFTDHVNVNWLMFMAKKHKYKAVGSKNFWHKNKVLVLFLTNIGIIFDTHNASLKKIFALF